nr:unnamed protein product [Callosobruchus chinensis]
MHGIFLFETSDFNCPTCNKIYAKKSTLARHIKYECNKLPRFGCSLCSYRGYQKTHVERHLSRRHDIQTRFEIKQNIFMQRFCSLETPHWLIMIMSFSGFQFRFPCPKCNKSYTLTKNLQRHLSVECGKQKQFRCAFCNNSYYYKRDLKMHAIRIHNIVDMSHMCSRCGKIYKYEYSLFRHLGFEYSVKPMFKCDFCGHTSKRKHDLNDHIKKRHPEQFLKHC